MEANAHDLVLRFIALAGYARKAGFGLRHLESASNKLQITPSIIVFTLNWHLAEKRQARLHSQSHPDI